MFDDEDFFVRLGINLVMFFFRLGINLVMFFFFAICSYPFFPKTKLGWLFLFGICIPLVILLTLFQPLSDKYRKYFDKKTEGQNFSILRILSALVPIVIMFAIMLLVIFYVANYFNIDINSIK